MTINVELVNKAFNNLQMWLGILMVWLVGIIPTAVFINPSGMVWVIYLCSGAVITAISLRAAANIGDAL